MYDYNILIIINGRVGTRGSTNRLLGAAQLTVGSLKEVSMRNGFYITGAGLVPGLQGS